MQIPPDGWGPYDLLLALTVGHAYGVPVMAKGLELDPKLHFERLVARGLRNQGLQVAGLSALRQEGRSFRQALELACQQVGLPAFPGNTVYRRRAVDGGIDVLAHVSIPPVRHSAAVLVCQATCGRSETWESKLAQTASNRWGRLLGTEIPPHGVLALPHHVADRHLRYLEVSGPGMILDRLHWTMALARSGLGSSDRQIPEVLAQLKIEAPRGSRIAPDF